MTFARVILAATSLISVLFAARPYVGDSRSAAIAAFALAVSPIYFFLSRQALDYICPITFVIAWLYLLARLDQRPDARVAFACGVVPGAG